MATAIGPSAWMWIVENRDRRHPGLLGHQPGAGRGAVVRAGDAGRGRAAAVPPRRRRSAAAAKRSGRRRRPAARSTSSSLAAQGLQMGDDVHMRTQASTNLLIRTLLPHLLALESPARVELGRFLAGNHLFFLNLAMAAARSLLAWARRRRRFEHRGRHGPQRHDVRRAPAGLRRVVPGAVAARRPRPLLLRAGPGDERPRHRRLGAARARRPGRAGGGRLAGGGGLRRRDDGRRRDA